jgi:trehalose 6-phosphate synthase
VLVLSRFTGAAEELKEAVLINPYAADEFAEALRQALGMPEEEQERRMRLLRRQVADNNIYRWAGMLLSEAGKLVAGRPLPRPAPAPAWPARGPARTGAGRGVLAGSGT